MNTMKYLFVGFLLTLTAHAGVQPTPSKPDSTDGPITGNIGATDPEHDPLHYKGVGDIVGSPNAPYINVLLDAGFPGYHDHESAAAKRGDGQLNADFLVNLDRHAYGHDVHALLGRAVGQIDAWNAQLTLCQRTQARECDRILHHDIPRRLHGVLQDLEFLADNPRHILYQLDEPIVREALAYVEEVIHLMMTARI